MSSCYGRRQFHRTRDHELGHDRPRREYHSTDARAATDLSLPHTVQPEITLFSENLVTRAIQAFSSYSTDSDKAEVLRISAPMFSRVRLDVP